MSRVLLSTDAAGSPTSAAFEADANALLAALTSSIIWSFNLILTDKFPATTRFFRLVVDTEPIGVSLTSPYKVKVFEAYDDACALAMVRAFIHLNPNWFYAPLIYRYSDQLFGQPLRSLIILPYCQDGPGGAANWEPGTAPSSSPTTWDTAFTLNSTAVFSNADRTVQSRSAARTGRTVAGKTSGIWGVSIQRTIYGATSVLGLIPSTFNPNTTEMSVGATGDISLSGPGNVVANGSNVSGGPTTPKPDTNLDRVLMIFNLDPVTGGNPNGGTIAYWVNGVPINGGVTPTWYALPGWVAGQLWYVGQSPGGVDTNMILTADVAAMQANEQVIMAAQSASGLSN